jgi:hypothetical protein
LPKPSAYTTTHFFDSAKERKYGECYKSMLNRENEISFEIIIYAIQDPKSDSCFFFLYGSGGSGETFFITL